MDNLPSGPSQWTTSKHVISLMKWCIKHCKHALNDEFLFSRDEHYPYACVFKGECSSDNERRPSSNNKPVHQGELTLFRDSILCTGALNAEQNWYFRANWGCYFSCAQVQLFLGLFCDLRLQGIHQRLLFSIDLLQEIAENHLKHNPTWFIGSEIKRYLFYLGLFTPILWRKST